MCHCILTSAVDESFGLTGKQIWCVLGMLSLQHCSETHRQVISLFHATHVLTGWSE